MLGILNTLFVDQDGHKKYGSMAQQKSSSGVAFIVGLVAAVGGFLYGYDTGLINGILEMQYVTLHFPKNGNNFTVHERALITAILSLGTFFGALSAPLISDNFGRKFSIIVSSAIIFNTGNILQTASTNVTLLCIGRAISGLSVGILSAIVPLYQAEASPRWVRGSVVYTYQWAITWGLLIASAISQGTRKIANSGSYRIPIGLQFLWALILCGGMLFLPESPRYYVQKNDIHKALDSLSQLRRLPKDDPDLIEELVDIKANYEYELSFGKTNYLDCFRNGGGRHKQRLRMATGMGVHAFQQCSGINFIFYYGVNFFATVGVNNFFLMSFLTYAVNTLFTIPGLILVDIIGRRNLLLIGGTGMSFSNLLIGILGVSIKDDSVKSILSISFSCLFIAFFASSWGGSVWAVSSDIYCISIRQKAISINAASNWLVNFVMAYITPYLIDNQANSAALGNKIFFIWGGLNALGVVFVYFMVYETKGLRLEEVDFMYSTCENARASTNFKPQKLNYTGTGIVGTPYSHSLDNLDLDKFESSNTNLAGIDENKNSNQGAMYDINLSSRSSPRTSTSIPIQSESSDYQEYLKSFQKSSINDNFGSTSITSASIQKDLNQQLNNTEIYPTDQIHVPINLNLDPEKKMTIIAAPFFSQPPSDTDSDLESEDNERAAAYYESSTNGN